MRCCCGTRCDAAVGAVCNAAVGRCFRGLCWTLRLKRGGLSARRPHGRPRPTSTSGQAGQARRSGLAWRSKAAAQVRLRCMCNVQCMGALRTCVWDGHARWSGPTWCSKAAGQVRLRCIRCCVTVGALAGAEHSLLRESSAGGRSCSQDSCCRTLCVPVAGCGVQLDNCSKAVQQPVVHVVALPACVWHVGHPAHSAMLPAHVQLLVQAAAEQQVTQQA
jgi:hypothetical protein